MSTNKPPSRVDPGLPGIKEWWEYQLVFSVFGDHLVWCSALADQESVAMIDWRFGTGVRGTY